MRARAWLAASALTAGLAATAFADPAPDRVEELVTRLGSGAYRDREAATRELDALGPNALHALRRAIGSTDPETRRRAVELVGRINERLATARILAPSTVEFKYENKPVIEAIVDFNKRSGATFTFDNPGKFHGRTVTAATPGPIPFWDAVELLCRKADLKEWDGVSRINGMATPPAASGFGGQIQGQVIFARSGRRPTAPPSNGMILLDGPGAVFPTCRAGAVRVRVPPPGTQIDGLGPVAADELVVPLQMSAEPKLNWQGAVDVRIDRALDERGRKLTTTSAVREASMEDDEQIFVNVNGMIMQVPTRRGGPVGVRVQRGDRVSTRLAELAGVVVAQVRVAEPLVRADDPFKAVGQTVRGIAGVALKITAADRGDSGNVTLGAEVRLPMDVQLTQNGVGAVQFAGQLQFQGGIFRQVRPGGEAPSLPSGTTEFQGLALEDANGKRFATVRGTSGLVNMAADGAVYQFTVTFKPIEKGQESARLVFTASRPATVEIPFSVKDIPLP